MLWALLVCLPVCAASDRVSGGYSFDNLPDLLERINRDVVLVNAYDSLWNKVAIGSGFFMDEGTIITCWHVIAEAQFYGVETSEGTLLSADSVEAIDFEGDLVKLKVESKGRRHKGIELATEYPRQGEKIIVVGNPLGFKGSISDGLVSAVREVSDFGTFIQITAPISPGSSGSPVINTRGEVVGVVNFSMTEGQNVNFAVPFDRIRDIDSLFSIQVEEYTKYLLEDHSTVIEDRTNQAIELMTTEDWSGALQLWNELTDSESDDRYPLYCQGYCLHQMGDFTMAIQQYEKSNSIEESDETYYFITLSQLRLGDTAEAIRSLENAVVMNPLDSVYLEFLGNLHWNYGSYHAANVYLNMYAAKYPSDTSALRSVCGCLREAEDYTGALVCYSILHQQDSTNALDRLGMGFSLYSLGRYTEAIPHFEAYSQHDPKNTNWQTLIGDCYSESGDFLKAVEKLETSISMNPNDASAHNLLGIALQELGEYRDALKCYKMAFELEPEQWMYCSNAAGIYEVLGETQDAQAYRAKADLLKRLAGE